MTDARRSRLQGLTFALAMLLVVFMLSLPAFLGTLGMGDDRQTCGAVGGHCHISTSTQDQESR